MSDQHIDAASLQELREIMEDEFEMLIHVFIEDAQEKLKQIQDGINAQAREEVRAPAHAIKGSSANICAGPLSQLCASLELQAKLGEGTFEEYQQQLEAIKGQFEHTKVSLLAFI